MYKYLLLVLMMTLWLSCERQDNVYTAGKSWVNPQSRLVMIDTLTMKTSTVIMDSVVSSGKSKILIGSIKDSSFGKIESSSFFELVPKSYSINTQNKPVFDSIVMYLTYNDHYYGDTLKTFKLDVYPIESRIKLNNDGHLYNTSKTKYNNLSIGSASFKPRPKKDSTYVRLPLDRSYGESIFNLLKSKDAMDQEYFLNFFKGLAIVPSSDNNALLRFGIDPNYVIKKGEKNISTLVRLFYHTTSENGTDPVLQTLDINPNIKHQYNKISYDFSGSELQKLTPKTPIASVDIGHKSMMISGIGVYTKVEFPYLKSIHNLFTNYKLLYANLYLSPVAAYQSKLYYQPKQAFYYLGSKNNSIVSGFTDSSGSDIPALLTNESEFNKDHAYVFPLANFVNNTMNEDINSHYSILTYSAKNTDAFVNQIIVGDKKHANNPAKAQLYFISY